MKSIGGGGHDGIGEGGLRGNRGGVAPPVTAGSVAVAAAAVAMVARAWRLDFLTLGASLILLLLSASHTKLLER